MREHTLTLTDSELVILQRALKREEKRHALRLTTNQHAGRVRPIRLDLRRTQILRAMVDRTRGTYANGKPVIPAKDDA